MKEQFGKEYMHFDFVVVGGGMTGLCAAIAAARGGARVALIHDRPVLGGNASGEVRMHICGANSNMKKPHLTEGGILHELLLSNKRVNDSFNFSIWEAVLFDAAKREKNLSLFLNTTMHNATANNGRVEKIDCYQLTTERHLSITADIFADCTGNGTLCAFVGAEFTRGCEGQGDYNEPHAPEQANNHRMGNTLLFKAIDRGRPVKFIPPVEVIHFTEEQLRYRKHSPDIDPELLKSATTEERRLMFEGYARDYGYWWIEICGEDDDIIKEYETIRDQLVAAVYGIWDHIKNDGEHGADNYELSWVGMLPGMRESRRILCDYMLNENDLLENRRFADKVAYGGWSIDVHHGLFAFDQKPSFIYPVEGSYDIPYRSYCVKGYKNLFVGGRCMGTSKLAMSSTRVIGTCAIGGQAIGTAAALLLQEKRSDIRAINISALQQKLLKDDCFLPELPAPIDKSVLSAQLFPSSEAPYYPVTNLKSGINRDFEEATHSWRSLPISSDHPAILSISFAEAAKIRGVQLIFDSNFAIEKKITLSSTRQKQQEIGIPKELVKNFELLFFKEDRLLYALPVENNYQRLVRLTFDPLTADRIELRITATNGAPEARLFAFDLL